MNKIFTVAILGVGARGGDIYGTIISRDKRFRIVSLCDKRKERLERFKREFSVDGKNCFLSEDVFFKEKRADLIIIATQDADHAGHMLKAFEKGYDILVEKPLTDREEECRQLLSAQKKYGGKVLVCHVLRYAPAFLKVGELLREKIIGKLVCIDALERVSYWHQAHSYVRGNWRNSENSSPMILAKCCHDLDLLQHYADSECRCLSSVGGLMFFNRQNMPEGACDRCTECQFVNSCPYSAKRIYIERWEENGSPADGWPFNIIAAAPLTRGKLEDAIKKGPYGRCVFACDNDAVDHQITAMTFENGVKATLTMTAFTYTGGRRMVFHGTKGEIVFDEAENKIITGRYGEKEETINLKDLTESGYGHGGGDTGLIGKLYDMLTGDCDAETSLEASIESHLMGIYAEKSRLKGGELVYPHG